MTGPAYPRLAVVARALRVPELTWPWVAAAVLGGAIVTVGLVGGLMGAHYNLALARSLNAEDMRRESRRGC